MEFTEPGWTLQILIGNVFLYIGDLLTVRIIRYISLMLVSYLDLLPPNTERRLENVDCITSGQHAVYFTSDAE